MGIDTANALPLLAAALTSFVATCLFLPWLIKSLRGSTVVGKDLNKAGRPLVPEMGGLGVILGSYAGVSALTVLSVGERLPSFYYAALTAALGAGIVGLVDDMFGLRKRTKAVLPFLFALPLGTAVMASNDTVLLGLNIGIWIVPAVAFGVTSAANAANMLEGFNGLGAGLMLIIDGALICLSLLYDAGEGLFLLVPLVGALAAFLWFNRYPARVFPGDSMTLLAGATLASAAIISSPSLKALGALLFTPMIVEFCLKARGRFTGENYGELAGDDRLTYRGRVESLSHFLMRRRPRGEREIVVLLWGIQLCVAVSVIALGVVLRRGI